MMFVLLLCCFFVFSHSLDVLDSNAIKCHNCLDENLAIVFEELEYFQRVYNHTFDGYLEKLLSVQNSMTSLNREDSCFDTNDSIIDDLITLADLTIQLREYSRNLVDSSYCWGRSLYKILWQPRLT